MTISINDWYSINHGGPSFSLIPKRWFALSMALGVSGRHPVVAILHTPPLVTKCGDRLPHLCLQRIAGGVCRHQALSRVAVFLISADVDDEELDIPLARSVVFPESPHRCPHGLGH